MAPGSTRTPSTKISSVSVASAVKSTPNNLNRAIPSITRTLSSSRSAHPLKRLDRPLSTARTIAKVCPGSASKVPIRKGEGSQSTRSQIVARHLKASENTLATPLKGRVIAKPTNTTTDPPPLTGSANALIQSKQTLAMESTLLLKELQQHNDMIETLKCEKMNLTNQVDDLQSQLRELKKSLEMKNNELETVEMRYHHLDSLHRSCKQDLERQTADNERLSRLLDKQTGEALHLTSSLNEAIAERDLARRLVSENESRLRLLHNQVMELKGNIRVFARIRPQTDTELKLAVTAVSEDTLSVTKPPTVSMGTCLKHNEVQFNFDCVLPPEASQAETFAEIDNLVISALDGYNVCIFAYGQTGSGKTYTMEGPPGIDFEDDSQSKHFGIIPRVLRRIFELTDERRELGWTYSLEVSFLEIYNETINDLLDRNKAKECVLRQTTDPHKIGGVFVENLLSVSVKSIGQIAQLIKRARNNRSVAATRSNARSSRSHSVYQLHITGQNLAKDLCRQSVLNLVDLAGSERVKHSGVEGAQFTEAKNINLSLTQLSTVLMSLGNKAGHIPYRNSKLTHLLSNSLGGNSKTLMFVNISPAAEHVTETLNSLKFAQKVNAIHIGSASKNK